MVKKGDIIIHEFGFSLIESKVIKVYDGEYIKIRHWDSFTDKLIPYTQIIKTSQIKGIN